MNRQMLAYPLLLGILGVPLAAAETYQIQISTNVSQEQVLGILYTRDCQEAVAESQPPLAGCTGECVCNPIVSEKQTYLLGKLADWFESSREVLLRNRGREVAQKYKDLPPGLRKQVDNAAGLSPLE
jgi:hypothetical protein